MRQVFAERTGGILASDASGKDWFVDFDPRGHPGLADQAGVLANRIFGAFGLNVPEDHVVEMRREELMVPAPDPGTPERARCASRVRGSLGGRARLRARASRAPGGTWSGPSLLAGCAIDDPNDLVPHENRRTLRALRVLGAFVNLQEIRPANTLDVYEGEAGQGFVRHYFLDLGQAFGGYSANSRRYWSGYNHYFSLQEAAQEPRDRRPLRGPLGGGDEDRVAVGRDLRGRSLRARELAGDRGFSADTPQPARGRLLGGRAPGGLPPRPHRGPRPLRRASRSRAPKSTW